MNWISKPFRDLCRDQACYIGAPGIVCADKATVVPCHSNQLRHGHGLGIKAHDAFTVPGCMRCHSWLDHGWYDSNYTRDERERVFMLAWERWMLDLLRSGRLVIAGNPVPTAQTKRRPVPAGKKLRGKQGKASPTSSPAKCMPRR